MKESNVVFQQVYCTRVVEDSEGERVVEHSEGQDVAEDCGGDCGSGIVKERMVQDFEGVCASEL